jgi:hypothetical protein
VNGGGVRVRGGGGGCEKRQGEEEREGEEGCEVHGLRGWCVVRVFVALIEVVKSVRIGSVITWFKCCCSIGIELKLKKREM